MPTISCTSRLAAVGPVQAKTYPGTTVSGLLDAAHTDYPRLQSYLLDDQGHVRKHVAIFVDGQLLPRSSVLQHPLTTHSDVHIMQALSGG